MSRSSPEAFPVEGSQRIALGTVQFGMPYGIANQTGQVSAGEGRRIVQIGADFGVDTIDTAIGYCESEDVLGQIGVSSFRVITKLPKLPEDVADVASWVDSQVQAALMRLRVSRLYGLLLHYPMDLAGVYGDALYRSLCRLRDRLQVEKIGISIYAPEELAALMPHCQFDLVQAPLNLLDRRLHTTGWLHRLKDRGVEIHTRSTFLQGLLLMSRAQIPAKFARWDAVWDRWDRWLPNEPDAAVRACLGYPLSRPEVDRVVVGADSADQFRHVLSSAIVAPSSFPDLSCDDEHLINPAHWATL